MIIGVLKEPSPETRVSLLPEHILFLKKLKVDLCVEQGAGDTAFANHDKYAEAGAEITDRNSVLKKSDLILSINNFSSADIGAMKPGAVLLGVFQPLFHAALMKEWAAKGLTIFSMDMLPRTTRAQSMDVLSSQANIAGYKAVLTAANHFPKYFPMFMTAAGSIPPAKMLILGAGVAGLQAIATGKRLGAVVEVFDTRPAVKEEVMSLGAKFVEVEGAADASKAGGYAVEQSEDFMNRQKAKIGKLRLASIGDRHFRGALRGFVAVVAGEDVRRQAKDLAAAVRTANPRTPTVVIEAISHQGAIDIR